MINLELFRKLSIAGHSPVDLDKITEKSYRDLEEKIWRENLESSPHGHPWFSSFHASSFPGGEKPCGRLAMYTMMDIPQEKPIEPFLRAAADIGKAVEYQIVYRWAKAGLTLGVKAPKKEGDEMPQVKFTDPSVWLTGASDAILDLRPEYDSVLPVDIKSKKHDVVEDMIYGRKGYEEKHFLQVQAYMYLCNLFHEEMGWKDMDLQPAKGAFIYYVSRQDPRTTKEFYIPIDWEVINNGVSLLKDWKESFESEALPERPPSWRWTDDPCRFCWAKRHACKPDYKLKITSLKESKTIDFAKELRKDYDFEKKKSEVLKRWHT
jgi:hypothetical protein